MSPTEFILFTLDHWFLLLINIFICTILLILLFRKITPLHIFDPFHFFFSFTIGTTYGELITLYLSGYIEDILFWKIFLINITFVIGLLIAINLKNKHSINLYLLDINYRYFSIFFKLVTLAFLIISILILIKTGPLIFYESRFEAVKGFGLFKRIFDVIRLFLIGLLTIKIIDTKDKPKKYFLIILLVITILISSIINGAKFALLESLYMVALSYILYRKEFKISLLKASLFLFIATLFALFTLYIQSLKSGYNQSIYGTNFLVLERFIHRVLSNGDQTYMLVPNNVIDEIKVNNPLITFIAPLIGSTNLSKLVGYNVNDYNVGRQAILYYFPNFEIAGGPTSHFDLFAYKYFGFLGGILFTLLLVFIIRCMLSLFKTVYFSPYRRKVVSVVVGTLWLRGLAIILEPSIGIAHMLDVIIIFFILKVFTLIIGGALYAKSIGNSGGIQSKYIRT